jgi:glycosyltransferase involved in cell wall biosynthesis
MVSIILCTYNPDRDLLEWALESIEQQTLSRAQFELIVVDNNSDPSLSEETVKGKRSMRLRLIREPRQGLSFARCAGITAAEADLLVFVDDDNYLDGDYLENAVRIAEKEPEIGLFGGIAKGVFERPVPAWKEKLLPYLGVRDYGPEPITSKNEYWGKWEPIGAGMVSRRDVGEEFVGMVEHSLMAGELGRKGQSLLSGEDSLFARLANRLGYSCSYQPALKLSHFIKNSRLEYSHLAGTLKGHGRSYVLLQRVTGNEVQRPESMSMYHLLVRRFFSRIRSWGLRAGIIHWFWDVGFLLESRNGSGGTGRENN